MFKKKFQTFESSKIVLDNNEIGLIENKQPMDINKDGNDENLQNTFLQYRKIDTNYISPSLFFNVKNDEKIKKNVDNDHLIIYNLEHELKQKNEEIKKMKKNFTDKIGLIENENKVSLNNLESEFTLLINNIKKNYYENVNGLEINSSKIKNSYDDIISKLHANILNLKNDSIDSKIHERIIQEIKTKTFIRIEDEKDNYNKKLKELIDYFDKPDYRKLMNNINFYLKFKEKFDLNYDDIYEIPKTNFTDQEYDLWMDKIKLNLITAECDYINGIIGIENEYNTLYDTIKYNEHEKLNLIEKEINDKFNVFYFLHYILLKFNFFTNLLQKLENFSFLKENSEILPLHFQNFIEDDDKRRLLSIKDVKIDSSINPDSIKNKEKWDRNLQFDAEINKKNNFKKIGLSNSTLNNDPIKIQEMFEKNIDSSVDQDKLYSVDFNISKKTKRSRYYENKLIKFCNILY